MAHPTLGTARARHVCCWNDTSHKAGNEETHGGGEVWGRGEGGAAFLHSGVGAFSRCSQGRSDPSLHPWLT